VSATGRLVGSCLRDIPLQRNLIEAGVSFNTQWPYGIGTVGLISEGEVPSPMGASDQMRSWSG